MRMVEGTRFKESEKIIIGLSQHQECQKKMVEDHQGALEVVILKMNLLQEAVNGGRIGFRSGNGRHEERDKF